MTKTKVEEPLETTTKYNCWYLQTNSRSCFANNLNLIKTTQSQSP